MPLPLSNSFEGGTNGAAITVANSGGASGNAFDTGSLQDSGGATGGSLTYDNTHVAHGSLSAKIVLGTGAAAESVGWGSASMGGHTDFYVRFYLYLTGAVPVSMQLVRFFNSGVLVTNVQLNATTPPSITIRNAVPTGTVTTPSDIPVNQWIRVEVHYFAGDGSTTGQATIRLYYTADSSTPDHTYIGTAGNYGAASNDVRVGNQSSSTLINYSYWLDEVAASATDWIGPWTSGSQTVMPVSDVAIGGWLPSVGTSLFGAIDETPASDSDYIASPQSPTTAVEAKVRLGPVADPLSSTGHVIHYRYQKDVAAGDTITLTVTLYAADGVTQIAQWVHSNIQSGVVQADQTLTGTQADAIATLDYSTGLVLGFKAVKV